jgi:predicted small metal-binding protein
MKAFACGSVVPGCTAQFVAQDLGQLLEQVAEHARRDHEMAEIPPEVLLRVRENVRDL